MHGLLGILQPFREYAVKAAQRQRAASFTASENIYAQLASKRSAFGIFEIFIMMRAKMNEQNLTLMKISGHAGRELHPPLSLSTKKQCR